METKEYIEGLVQKSRAAQKIFAEYSQAQVDRCVRAAGKAVYDRGEELARVAVEETHMGSYADKILKNKGKSMAVWNHLKNKKSIGVLRIQEEEGIIEIAKPMGVVGAIAPVTNPVMTPMHNAMIALKSGNAIIIAPHPAGKNTGMAAAEAMRRALRAESAPADLIQCIEPDWVGIEASAALMRLADVCVATGGPGVVKAAYSSGKPAYGVGAGNMQCLVDADADPAAVAPKILQGRTYDNGILCTCEQNIICQEELYQRLLAELEKNGAWYVAEKEAAAAVRAVAFPGGKLNKALVGLPADAIAELAGIRVPAGIRALIVPALGPGKKDLLAREKLFPVIAAFQFQEWEEGVSIAKANLELEGAGHSSSIHSFNNAHILYAGLQLPVSRLLVNGVGSSGVGGAYSNGFVPTATLGCGTWGNNSISENLDYVHLMNISRIGFTNPEAKAPTPEEVWG